MLSKKKKIFVLVGMVALLAAAACLNIFLNRGADKASGGGDVTMKSFFETYRTDRTATREQTMLYYDAIIANAASTEQAKADAEAAKLELAKNMEVELVIEGLIKSLGFEDAVVTNTTENVNVIVKSEDALTSAEAAQILEIITTETDKTALDVRIIPVE